MEFTLNAGIFRKMKSPHRLDGSGNYFIRAIKFSAYAYYRYDANVYLNLCGDLTFLFVSLTVSLYIEFST